jgi:hypothetical protein
LERDATPALMRLLRDPARSLAPAPRPALGPRGRRVSCQSNSNVTSRISSSPSSLLLAPRSPPSTFITPSPAPRLLSASALCRPHRRPSDSSPTCAASQADRPVSTSRLLDLALRRVHAHPTSEMMSSSNMAAVRPRPAPLLMHCHYVDFFEPLTIRLTIRPRSGGRRTSRRESSSASWCAARQVQVCHCPSIVCRIASRITADRATPIQAAPPSSTPSAASGSSTTRIPMTRPPPTSKRASRSSRSLLVRL